MVLLLDLDQVTEVGVFNTGLPVSFGRVQVETDVVIRCLDHIWTGVG